MSSLRSTFGSARDDVWDQIATDIGGNYKEGGQSGQDILHYQVGQWEVTLDSYAVGDANARMMFTRMRAPFLNKDGLYFKISREGVFAHIQKMLGIQDIQTGDEFFDKNFLIKGNNEEKVKLLLKSPELKKLIHAQPDISFQIRDDEGWFGESFPEGVDELYFECSGFLDDPKLLKLLFDMFSITLERLVRIDSAYENDPEVEL